MPQPSALLELSELINSARHATPKNQRVINDDLVLVDNRRSGLVGSSGTLSLRALLPALINSEGRIYSTPAASAPAGEIHTLDRALIQNSRVMQAGSRLVVMPDSLEPVTNSADIPAFRDEPASMVNINAASFDALALDVNDEGTVTAQALPIAEAAITDAAWTQRAVRFELNRSLIKSKGMTELSTEVMTALALGIGRAADAQLLTAINATTPSAFSLAAAAAAGLRFDELRALVGTAAAGAVVNDAGQLRVAGVPAELTADMTQTLVAAWGRSGVAVSPEIRLLVERIQPNGSLAITAWVDMQALIPEPAKFWAVV